MYASMVNNRDEMDANWVKRLTMFPSDANGLEKFQNGEITIFTQKQSESKGEYTLLFYFRSADWYEGRLTAKQLDELENPPTTTEKPKATKVSRRKSPFRKQQRKPQSEEEAVDLE